MPAVDAVDEGSSSHEGVTCLGGSFSGRAATATARAWSTLPALSSTKMTLPDATRHEVDRCSKKSRSGVDETELVRQVPHVEHPIEAQLGSVVPVLGVG
jgi:hypothetical protein